MLDPVLDGVGVFETFVKEAVVQISFVPSRQVDLQAVGVGQVAESRCPETTPIGAVAALEAIQLEMAP